VEGSSMFRPSRPRYRLDHRPAHQQDAGEASVERTNWEEC